MTITTDFQCKLPDVLTDYLGSLIASETEALDAVFAYCRLDPGEKGGRPIQIIEFLGKRHIVFGFTPVQCKLSVLISHERCIIGLAD